MRKITPLILAILVFSGCATPVEKNLTEIGWEASCVTYEIQDENGGKIAVPKEIEESLSCVTGAVALSHDFRFLLYADWPALKTYNFETGDINELVSLDEDLEGIACVWANPGVRIACAVVNQQKYDGGTKFTVMDVEEGRLVSSKDYFITADKMADFECGASCYPGSFWFEHKDLIKYEGHKITAPGQIFDLELEEN
ncbi:hypothetical protein C0416_03860 [bacterium]|nr:hypothetical protein [bacterium]